MNNDRGPELSLHHQPLNSFLPTNGEIVDLYSHSNEVDNISVQLKTPIMWRNAASAVVL